MHTGSPRPSNNGVSAMLISAVLCGKSRHVDSLPQFRLHLAILGAILT
jgi:hypothetical protein